MTGGFLEHVNRAFDRAAALTDHPAGLLEQIRACNSGLEETMVRAYGEVRDTARREGTDLRTAALALAIGKVARVYGERGIFP